MTRKDLAEYVLRVLRQIDKLTLPEQLDVILAANTFIEIEARRAVQQQQLRALQAQQPQLGQALSEPVN